ncbi:MAG: hypothetical protein B6I25_01870, partial [Planctomycetales bacterium 4572_13]
KMASHSPAFYGQSWRKMEIKETTRGSCIWDVKSAVFTSRLAEWMTANKNCKLGLWKCLTKMRFLLQ